MFCGFWTCRFGTHQLSSSPILIPQKFVKARKIQCLHCTFLNGVISFKLKNKKNFILFYWSFRIENAVNFKLLLLCFPHETEWVGNLTSRLWLNQLQSSSAVLIYCDFAHLVIVHSVVVSAYVNNVTSSKARQTINVF